MKKKVLKRWVKVMLGVLFAIGFILGAMDFENTKTFIISKAIAFAILFIVFAITWTQTDLFE